MKVSIITATYNSAKTIIDTLISLEKQTYENIEYIIIDGSSKDDTLKVINNNCSRVSTIISEPDSGIYDALNKGLQFATGDIVGFLHSDDLFAYPEAVSDIVNTFQENDCDAIYADLQYVNKDDIESIVRYWKAGEYNINKITKGWMPPHPTFYMKRSCYKRLGLFDLSFRISADYDSILRYLYSNKISISYLPKVTIKMRVGGASNRNIRSIVLKTKEDIRALKNSEVPWAAALAMKNISKLSQFIKR